MVKRSLRGTRETVTTWDSVADTSRPSDLDDVVVVVSIIQLLVVVLVALRMT